ncbi:hypothetical protein GCM10009111_19720 [Colwellia asteriadis]|uniref:DUF4340 domain-containing protein n=1 Tax=Colwellia asteriadis TaxID=517723 RepID=A0ABN1L826_9GAMM
MKLSRTGWNNVIIFSVMLFILLINTTNNKLFPNDDEKESAQATILPAQSVILTLSMHFPNNTQVIFERAGLGWQVTTKGVILSFSDQQVEQIILAWQQSEGLMQADDIIIDEQLAIKVNIATAGGAQHQNFMVYPLNDQLLVYKQTDNLWLAFPVALTKQLLPY